MTPCTRVCLHSYVRWDHHCVCLYLEGFRLGLYVERELKLHLLSGAYPTLVSHCLEVTALQDCVNLELAIPQKQI